MKSNTKIFLIIIYILNIIHINNLTSNLKQEEKKEKELDLFNIDLSKMTVLSVFEAYSNFVTVYNYDDIYELVKDNQVRLKQIIEENVKEANIDKKSLLKNVEDIFSMSNEVEIKESLLRIIKKYKLENCLLNTSKSHK